MGKYVKTQKAVFFDRDGVLNEKLEGYVWRWEQFRWRLGAISAVKAANLAGYKVIILTNQAGIAHQHYTERDVVILHDAMSRDLARHAAHVDRFYYCPHHPTGKDPRYAGSCHCRKPAPGMLESAIDEFDLDPKQCYMIGDQESDLKAGTAAGVDSILLRPTENVGTVINFLLAKRQAVLV